MSDKQKVSLAKWIGLGITVIVLILGVGAKAQSLDDRITSNEKRLNLLEDVRERLARIETKVDTLLDDR